MSENETNELREALNSLIDVMPGDGCSLLDTLMDFAYAEKMSPEVFEMWRPTYNAARVVARFIEWGEVPEGEIT